MPYLPRGRSGRSRTSCPYITLRASTAPRTPTSPPLTAPAQRFYRPELDILRFFAFLCVFIHHTVNRRNSGGALASAAEDALSFAVSLFFLLSAFLITTLLELELERTGDLHVGAFYVRRIARIWPLYYFFLSIWVVIGLVLPEWRMTGGSIAAWVLMVGNWHIVLNGLQVPAVAIIWSVNVEEQFYLFCPWVVAIFRRRGLIAFSVATIGVSFATLFWMGLRHNFENTSLRLNTLVELQLFAVGTLAAIFVRRRELALPLAARAAFFLFGLGCWVFGTYSFDSRSAAAHFSWWSPAAEYALVTLGCVALFFSFYGAVVGRLGRPFVYLGKISYGLYLYHILFAAGIRAAFPQPGGAAAKIAKAALSLGLTVATAAASYAWLEKPFLRMKDRFTFVKSRAA